MLQLLHHYIAVMHRIRQCRGLVHQKQRLIRLYTFFLTALLSMRWPWF